MQTAQGVAARQAVAAAQAEAEEVAALLRAADKAAAAAEVVAARLQFEVGQEAVVPPRLPLEAWPPGNEPREPIAGGLHSSEGALSNDSTLNGTESTSCLLSASATEPEDGMLVALQGLLAGGTKKYTGGISSASASATGAVDSLAESVDFALQNLNSCVAPTM